MATPFRLKRSAVSGKRPTLNDLQLGELALNTYDAYLYGTRDAGGVGIGTTVTLLTPWTENFGAASIYYKNSVGIGTTNPLARFQVGSATTNTTMFVVTANGDVGIGTTNPEHSDKFGALTLDGYPEVGSATTAGGGNIILKSNGQKFVDLYSVTGYVGSAPHSALTILNLERPLQIKKAPGTNYVGGASTSYATIHISNSRVGLGTTNPTAILDVRGDTYLENLNVVGFTTIGTLAVAGVTTTQHLRVTGFTTTVNQSITGVATIGTLAVSGVTTSRHLNVAGVATFNQAKLGVVTSYDLIANGDYSNTINLGNDLFIYHVSDPLYRANFIHSDEYNLVLGNKSETGGNTSFNVLVGIFTGNDAFSNNTSYVSLNYGNSDTKLNTIGAGVTIYGTAFTNQLNVSGVSTLGTGVTITSGGNINAVSGVITATQFVTGAGAGITITNNTIFAPTLLVLDPSPAGVGTTSGVVQIKGDLYVDGTQFVVNSTTIELGDFNIGIATTVGTNALLDGAGLGIGSVSIRKNFTYASGSDSLKSSENFDLASGKVYKINGTEVLSATQLTVANVNAVGVSTLGTLAVAGVTTTQHLNVTGFTTVVNQSITGVATVGSNLAVAGVTTSQHLNVTGFTTVVNQSITGVATVGSNLAVAGVTTSQHLNITGFTTVVNQSITGVLTVTNGIQGIGIQSAGSNIATGLITAINFVGAGNSFSYNSGTKTVDINIGGSQWTFVDPGSPTTSSIYRVNGNVGIGTTNPTSKLHLVGDALITGVSTLTGNVSFGSSAFFGDNDILYFGDSNDLRINHDGSNSYIQDLGTGQLIIVSDNVIAFKKNGGEQLANFVVDDRVELYFDNSKKFETTGYGAAVFGILETQGLNVTGFTTVINQSITGVATVGSNLAVAGVTTTQHLNVTGFTTVVNESVTGVATIGTLAVAGVTTTQHLNVVGFTTVVNQSITGVATIGTLAVSGVTTTRHLNVTGFTTVVNQSITGVATVGLNLAVAGVTTTQHLNVVGFTTVVNQSITGVATVGSNLTVVGVTSTQHLNVSGIATINRVSITTEFNVYAPVATFHNDINIIGNVSIGGTTVVLNAAQLQIKDKDIILGITTNALGNDVSTDTSANHGGIAIASTEGTPLINIDAVGIDSIPNTYKQIMWIRSGTWTGLSTDAWLFNYGVGIGSTQIPNGVRLAVGSVQFTQNDLAVVRSINASGFITATTFNGQVNAGVATITTLSGTNINYSGVATVGSNLAVAGVTTTQHLNVTGFTTVVNQSITGVATVGSNLAVAGVTTTQHLNVTGFTTVINQSVTGVSTIGILNVGTAGTIINAQSGTVIIGGGTSTGTASQPLQVTGGAYVSGNLGIGNTNPAYNLHIIGTTDPAGMFFDAYGNVAANIAGRRANGTLASPTGVTTNNNLLVLQGGGYTTGSAFADAKAVIFMQASEVWTSTAQGSHIDFATTLPGTTTRSNKLRIDGYGNVLVGTSVSTGTTSQPLQVSGGAYVSGFIGIGVTNPDQILHLRSPGTNVYTRYTNDTINAYVGINTNNSSLDLYTGTNHSIRFVTGNATKGFLDINGNLILNTTNTATGTANQKLQVTGGAYVSGSVGIGTTNPGSTLTVQGNAYVTGVTTSTDFDSLSDINLKTNINQIADPLEKVMQIRGVTFDWKESNRGSAGVIAQEIEKVLPELVHGEETKTVNYNGLIGLLIECVKKQQEEIEQLKNSTK